MTKVRVLKQKLHSYCQLKGVKIKGKNIHVFGKIDIIDRQKLSIGDNCYINHSVYLNAQNFIQIGNDVTISAGAKLISTGIDYLSWSQGERKHISGGGILIGNHVWIGAGAIILNDIQITGKYVVIAAGAVVTKDIQDDYCIVAGCPAKIVKFFNEI